MADRLTAADKASLDSLRMDMDLRNRQLAAQIAESAAERAFQQKRLELIEQGMLQQEAEQFAKEFALREAEFEFEKQMTTRQFGLSERAQEFTEEIERRRQAFEESWRTAEQRGFYDDNGVKRPTFAREQFEREFAESQRQFDVSTIMNAPRGPADWAAFENRLRGLNAQGALPGVIGQLFQGQPGGIAGYSNAGQFNGPVASNTDLAFALTGAQPQQPAPAPQPQPAPAPQPQVVVPRPASGGFGQWRQKNAAALQQLAGMGIATPDDATLDDPVKRQQWYVSAQQALASRPAQQQAAPATLPATTGGAAAPQSGGGTPTAATFATGGPYGANAGSTTAAQQMFGGILSRPTPTTIPQGYRVSAQNWNALSPDEQQMALGYAQEYGGTTPQTFLYGMERAAPNYSPSRTGKFFGM